MRLPEIHGVIRRRILVNFRVDPDIVQRQLLGKFRPKLHSGFAIAGICLIRLEKIRPRFLPPFLGVSSENAAHRIAVLWENEKGQTQEGVFVPRRDTNSVLNTVAGGRIFPGDFHLAQFVVGDSSGNIDFEMKSKDGKVAVRLLAKTTKEMPSDSVFSTLKEASDFFEPGSLGYSATSNSQRLDGMTLKTKTWSVEPLEVEQVYSSYFLDEEQFPKASVVFDCALLMRNIEHAWQSAPALRI